MRSLFRKLFNIKSTIKIYSYIGIPLILPLSIILFFLNLRLINIIWVNAIGHLCLETECFLREKILNKKIKYKCLILAPENELANKYLVKHLRKYFLVITNNFLCILLSPLKNIKFFNHDISNYCMNIWNTATQYKIISDTRNIKPFYTLSEEENKKGYKVLEKFGVTKNDWFVTIHARDPFYRNNGNISIRDSNIGNYKKIVEYITSEGGYVFRMGSEKTNKFNLNTKRFIDYAHSEIRNDFMDIFLCAKSKIFIGTNSGLNNLPLIFGTPIIYLNLIPLSQLNSQPNSIGVPKLLKNKNSGKFLNFKECLSHPFGNSFYNETFEKANIEVIDNDENIILEATKEFLDRVNNNFFETEEDLILQKKFTSLLKYGHYGFGTSGKISTMFLRKYRYLL